MILKNKNNRFTLMIFITTLLVILSTILIVGLGMIISNAHIFPVICIGIFIGVLFICNYIHDKIYKIN